MSVRKTWIKGKMWFPDDIDPADIDWIKPLVAYQKPTTVDWLEYLRLDEKFRTGSCGFRDFVRENGYMSANGKMPLIGKQYTS